LPQLGSRFEILCAQDMLKTIRKALRSLTLLQELWSESRLVGQGSVGCVFVSGSTAFKVRIVQDELDFYHEVEMQNAFYPNAPKILDFGTQKVGKVCFGCIVMQKIDETLDIYLGKDLTESELNCVVQQLSALLKVANERNLVHGDLAFFNIGVSMRESLPVLEFIDFDDSRETTSFKNLDKLRIASECFSVSRGSAPMRSTNIDFIANHLVRAWFPNKTPKQLHSLWKGMYTKFKQVSCP
jgi:serine/threonine protein kinase